MTQVAAGSGARNAAFGYGLLRSTHVSVCASVRFMSDVDPRGYRSGTTKALFEMAKGTCYFPDCETKTIVFIDGEPLVNVQIAHIEGAEPEAARYREEMTNEERRSFPNLILLCTPHHDLVDNKKPTVYTTRTLQGWKSTRESATGADLAELSGITEETLVAAMEAAIRASRGAREAKLELSSGLLVENGAGLVMLPLGRYPTVIGDAGSDHRCVAVTVRSTGDLPVTVEGISTYYRLRADPTVESKLMGRDDYPGRNPRLPCRIEGGESKTWCTALSTFEMIMNGFTANGQEVTHFRYEVSLGSGEILTSEVHGVEKLDGV